MADFKKAAAVTLNLEGGYQNLKKDSGNYNSKGQLVGTNKGISAKTYEKWIKRVPTVADMKAITKETALEIYRQWYWKPIGVEALKDQQLATFIFDYAINGGGSDALAGVRRAFRKVFNILTKKAIPTGELMQALNKLSPQETAAVFEQLKQERIYDINTQGGTAYDDSLRNRVNEFKYILLNDLQEIKKKSQ